MNMTTSHRTHLMFIAAITGIAGIVSSRVDAQIAIDSTLPAQQAQVLQVQAGAAPVVNPADGKDQQSVYVRDSGVASEKLNLAQRMERLKEWNKSADVYQEIAEKYADRVIPARTDNDQNIIQYASVALVVQEKLAQWPKDGLDFYRSRYEDAARSILTNSPDRAALMRVFGLYFVTDAGKDAGLQLMRENLERGEFASAAWVGKRLLTLHPNLIAERAQVLFTTAICEHLSANTDSAKERLKELQTHFADSLGTVRGSEVKLADTLEQELKVNPSLARIYRSDSWPMPFGTPDRSAIPANVISGGAKLFSIELPSLTPRGANAANLRQFKPQIEKDRAQGMMTGIIPVVDRGELFFQDNTRVYAINLQSGSALPGWTKTYPGEKKGYFSIEGWPMPRQRQNCIAVTDRVVFAVMGQVDLYGQIMGYGVANNNSSQLVALDRETGKRLWASVPRLLKVPKDNQNLNGATLFGSPLVIDDTVYVLAKCVQGGQFEEVHVVALSAVDGTYKWSSYIASAANGNNMMGWGGMDEEGNPDSGTGSSHLSFADGRLYVQTNLGALGCIDAYDGKIFWLNIYATPDKATNRRRVFVPSIQANTKGTRAFAFNPVIVMDGRVFTLPTDGKYIFIYNASTGEEIKRIPRTILSNGGASTDPNTNTIDMILGIVGDKLMTATRGSIVMIPWASYDPSKSLLANNCITSNFKTLDGSTDALRGRPFVTANHILVPTQDNLTRIRLDNQKKDLIYPAAGRWDDEEQPGNVLITPEHLIIAGSSRVTVYTDLSLATKRLDDAIATTPTDPEPHIRAAEIYFTAAKSIEAVDHIDKAIDLLGGRTTMAHGQQRDRIYECLISNAQKLQKVETASSELINQLYDRVRDAAESDQQQARYRLIRADNFRINKRLPEAVELLQQVLLSDALRHCSAVLKQSLSSASAEAETTIAELITENGESIYATYETAAKAMYDEALASGNVDGLVHVADSYPNSKVSSLSLLTAAEKLENGGDPRAATSTLRRALTRASSNEAKLRIQEALTRNYLRIPGKIDMAIARIDLAAKDDPTDKIFSPITLPDGTKIQDVSRSEAANQLRLYRSKQYGMDLPVFGLKGGKDKTQLTETGAIGNVASIVHSVDGHTRYDKLVVWTKGKELAVIDSGSIAPMFPPVKFDEQPLGLTWSDQTVIVSGSTHMVAIDLTTGKQLWSSGLSGLPGVEVAIKDAPVDKGNDNANGPAQPQVIQMGGRLILRNGGAVRILGPGGVQAFNNGIQEDGEDENNGLEVFKQWKVLTDRVIACTTGGRIVAYDLKTGSTLWQLRPNDGAFRHFASTDDFCVVSSYDPTGASTVITIDARNGQILRQKTWDPNVQGQNLSNIALSDDGFLVQLFGNSIVGKNLYEVGEKPTYTQTIGNQQMGEMPGMAAIGADQLVISDDRIVLLYNAQQPTQAVRVYNLKTGKPATVKVENRSDIPQQFQPRLPPQAVGMPVNIRMVGPSMYLVSARSLMAYHLDKPNQQWSPNAPIDQRNPLRDLAIAQDLAVAIHCVDSPNMGQEQRIKEIQLRCFSRALVASGVESGVYTAATTLKETAEFVVGQWQITTGGFYYLTGDGKVKFLKVTTSQ